MSYLQDRQQKRKFFFKIGLSIFALVILFYFRTGIFNALSSAASFVFRPLLVAGNNTGEKFKNIGSYFTFKNSLYLENQELQAKLQEANAKMANYDGLLGENEALKEILGRKPENTKMILSAILSKPNQSAYDTLIIDAGERQGVQEGQLVFAQGNVPIGRVNLVENNLSKIVLFSNPGEKTQAVIVGRDIFMEVVGRGGGNFEMIIPRDLIVQKGDQVVWPGITPYVLAIIETIISDPRDPFTKALLTSPVNIQELKFVQIVH